MPQGQIVLCPDSISAGSLPGMPKQAKIVETDPAVTLMQKQTGERIAAIRELGGLTQTEIAVICGADQSQWSRWERGERPAELQPMLRFARRAQTSLDLIYRGIPTGTNEVLLELLRAKIPHLLVPDPTRTDQDMDKALASYRAAIRREAPEDV